VSAKARNLLAEVEHSKDRERKQNREERKVVKALPDIP